MKLSPPILTFTTIFTFVISIETCGRYKSGTFFSSTFPQIFISYFKQYFEFGISEMVEDKQNRACKVHNARFYTLAPRAINYLAYNRTHSQLALARLVILLYFRGNGGGGVDSD